MRDDYKYYYMDKNSMMIFDSTVGYVFKYEALPELK